MVKFIIKNRLLPVIAISLCVLMGFWVTSYGAIIWDTVAHVERSRWMMGKYRIIQDAPVDIANLLKWYGPFWELILGFFSFKVFAALRDPIWVRTAFGFALFPFTLWGSYRLLTLSGISRSTSLLATSMVFGFIRFGGHAQINPTDFPFACAYLLVSLSIWHLFKRAHLERIKNNDFSLIAAFKMGLIALIPFMIRPPMILQFVAVLIALTLYGVITRHKPFKIFLVTFFGPLLVMGALWPGIWEKSGFKGWHAWLQSFGGFVRFRFFGETRVLGMSFESVDVPAFYSFLWPVVSFNPLAFLLMLLGLILLVLKYKKIKTPSVSIPSRLGEISLSFGHTLWVFILIGWLGILLKKPVLYDEDRHLLFLYPPLLIASALGWDWIQPRLKIILALLLFFGSFLDYLTWGKYAYVYKSPLAIHRTSDYFMGDYWGVCVGEATEALNQSIPKNSYVSVLGPLEVSMLQYDRLRRWNSDYGPFQIGPTIPKNIKSFEIVTNRRRDLSTFDSKPLWTTRMPMGEISCMIREKVNSP